MSKAMMLFNKYTKWIPLYNYNSLGDGNGDRNRLVQIRRNLSNGLIEFRTDTITGSCYKDLGLDATEQFKKALEKTMIKTFIFKQSNKDNWNIIRDNMVAILDKIIERAKSGEIKKDFKVSIDNLKEEPTDNQRAYYWAVVLPLINSRSMEDGSYYSDLKMLHDDIREAIKDEFGLYVEVENKITGKIEKRVISLSKKKGDKETTRKYIEAVIDWAGKFYGLDIPSPYIKIQ